MKATAAATSPAARLDAGGVPSRVDPGAAHPLSIIPVPGLPEVEPGMDVASLLVTALGEIGVTLERGDVVVVTSKIVSKAEGAVVGTLPSPGELAVDLASATGFPPAEVQLILDQSRRVVRQAPGVLVTETLHGFVCANAGVDHSNAPTPGSALTLPADSDAWAAGLRARLETAFAPGIAVLVSDSFGRPFRNGQVNVAVGVSGMRALRDYRGLSDPAGHLLKGTELAVADELCAAAELVMNKLDRVPVAVIRGYAFEPDDRDGGHGGGVGPLLRDPALDLFR